MKRVIIYGFGEAGKQVADDILKNGNYKIVGFLDDDKNKWNLEYKNIKVIGDINSIGKLKNIDSLIIAMPSASIQRIREIEMLSLRLGIKDIKIVPSYYVKEDRVFLKHVVEIDIFDVFKKREMQIDYEALKLFYENKNILITGGAGSIGSYLVKEVLNFNVRKVIAMDIDETRLYELSNDLDDDRLIIYLGDITDDYCLYDVFQNHIDLVFHCAAYKHVPILENFEYMAYKVNFIGTKKLVEFSKRNGIKKFVFISTDKAVEPTSIMGKTKSIAEDLVIENNYIAVRFGNVIGSRGSLIPTILKQVQKGYVKITHKDAKRYFITPKEAVLLVLYSPIISNGGDILILDMGEPINVRSAIENLLKLLGYEPYKDIQIIFTDLRKGEKLEEKLFSDNETIEATENPYIYKVKKL
ncbi:MAG: polysaccharide biosynthesis protein [candidate division WOR-3 bacterium]|nr:polysaccharide biosynthesis protein [candidate division WOR-3 bacterium]MCX7947012.1 polysaccharide biosynthesis protein [candidate division WOR-3 bacterium]MDW8149947.1 polysaccharide biosynthesis protein [candidate division WOR-3 bacterium]